MLLLVVVSLFVLLGFVWEVVCFLVVLFFYLFGFGLDYVTSVPWVWWFFRHPFRLTWVTAFYKAHV